MTGPEHYSVAERLLDQLRPGHGLSAAVLQGVVATAQVHATLALAAATALQQREIPDDDSTYTTGVLCHDDHEAWWKAASEGPAKRWERQRVAEAELAEWEEAVRAVHRPESLLDETPTATWFAASKKAGCTGTAYDTDTDTILHDDAPPCPVHEPGDVVPAELGEQHHD